MWSHHAFRKVFRPILSRQIIYPLLNEGWKHICFYTIEPFLWHRRFWTVVFTFIYVCVVFGWLKNARTKNVVLAHGWESGYWCAGGIRSHGLRRFQILFCHPPLPDMPHPPTLPRSTCGMCKVEVKLFSSHSFCVIVRKLCFYVNTGQALCFGLEWLTAVCYNLYFTFVKSFQNDLSALN